MTGHILCVVLAAGLLNACSRPPAVTALKKTIDAMGGKDRILAVQNIVIEGEGIEGNLGQNRTPNAPLTHWKVTGFRERIDPSNRQMLFEQTRTAQFPFAGATPVREHQALDRDIAWDIDESGHAQRLTDRATIERRVEMLHHPLAIVRAALDPTAKVTGYREQGNLESMDVATIDGDTVTLNVDKTTHLPVSVVSRTDQPNLGDVTIRTSFSDYATVNGLRLPGHIFSQIDRWLRSDILVSKNTLDAAVNLAAPAPVRAALAPSANPPIGITVAQVAPGIWFLDGEGNYHSVVFEFSDHLTVFELPESEARAGQVIEKARSLAFGKPLTEVIVSHHHFDHAAGLRAAVAEGLTIVTQKGNVAFFQELLTRPHNILPDRLAMLVTPPPTQIRAVDDELVLKDDAMELDLYHVKDNSHCDTLLMGWVPRDRILIQADLYDSGRQRFPWADNLRENVALRKLRPEKDVPIHGKVESWADVLKTIFPNRDR